MTAHGPLLASLSSLDRRGSKVPVRAVALWLPAVLGGAWRLWIALRGGGLSHIPSVYDDGVYTAAGALLARGHVPYRDFVFVHPPGIVYLVSLAALVVRDPARLYVVMRLVVITVGVINVALVARLLDRNIGRGAALVGASVYAVIPEATYAEHTVLIEPVLNLAALAGAILWLSLDEIGPAHRLRLRARAALAGVFLGIAISTKLWGACAVVACVLARPRGLRAQAQRAFAAGFVGTVACLWLPMLALSGSAVGDQVVRFQLLRPADGTAGSLARLSRMAQPNEIIHAGTFRAVFAIAVVAVGISGSVLAWSRRCERLVATWFVLVVAVFLTSPTWWEQYDAHLAMCFALLAGVAFATVQRLVRRLRREQHRRLAAAFLGVSLVLAVGFVVDSAGYRRERTGELANVARDIRANVPTQACVIALEPGWLVVAGRLPVVGVGREFAVDPYASLLGNEPNGGRALADVFADPARQIALAAAVDECSYLVVSDYRLNLMINDDLREDIQDNFVEASGPSSAARVLRREPSDSGP